MEEFCCGVEVAVRRLRRPLAHVPGLFRYAVAGKPLELKFEHCEELAHRIRDLAHAVDFDIVQIEHSSTALYLETLPPSSHRKHILDFHNVVFDQLDRLFRIERRPVTKARVAIHRAMMRRWEPHYAERFDRCIAVSDVDRQLLIRANPRLQVDVVPNGVDSQIYRPLGDGNTSPDLLFIGTMSYSPCADAAVYFCREVLPRIWRAMDNVELWIVGRDPPPEVMRLSGDRVHVTGRVADVVPYYARTKVCVVPLRAGGGTRLKILEAMALGRPVVSTTMGCEGLDVVNGRHILIADSPETLAEMTLRLLTDRALCRRLTTNARELVVTHYDWDLIANRLMQIYDDITKSLDGPL